MTFRAGGLLRLAIASALTLVVMATLIGRFSPPPEVPIRVPDPFPQAIVRGHLVLEKSGGPLLLDSESLELRAWAGAESLELSEAGGSPWREGKGRWQVAAGLWSGSSQEVAIVRLAFPSGELLDFRPTDVLPAGSPCWFPDRSLRILFPAADGRIYRLDFEPDPLRGEQVRRPEPLAWSVLPAGPAPAITDPVWPNRPELGGRLIASLRFQSSISDPNQVAPARLWWLQLNATGSAIVAAGPLTDPARAGASTQPDFDELLPEYGVTPDGQPMLAFLAKRVRRSGMELRIAPIRFDEETGHPFLDRQRERALVSRCTGTRPIFSRDGSRVACLLRPNPGETMAWSGPTDPDRQTTLVGRDNTLIRPFR